MSTILKASEIYFRFLSWALGAFGVVNLFLFVTYYSQVWSSLHSQGISNLALTTGLIITVLTGTFFLPLIACFLGTVFLPRREETISGWTYARPLVAAVASYYLPAIMTSGYFVVFTMIYDKVK